ncbi:hypothetical protein HDU87_005332 [Geranomyces variabilis]|uniref:Pkinase-domain-containing protein n=1 Tax=Geranomyces variabilis TaxID=109894 RepID=A0AAD5TJC5_9FUNG|nr:hypothetical protein HDU87_005332 [Geranomyces variabilis]
MTELTGYPTTPVAEHTEPPQSPATPAPASPAAACWTPGQVAAWLEEEDLQRYAKSFSDAQVTGRALLGVTYEDLRTLGVLNLKHRAKILNLVAALNKDTRSADKWPRSANDYELRPPNLIQVSPGPYSAPLPFDIPYNLLQHSDPAVSPPRAQSRLAAGASDQESLSSIAATVPPRTKSIEAFPTGWDARLPNPPHSVMPTHTEHVAETVTQLHEHQQQQQQRQPDSHRVLRHIELPPRIDSHMPPNLHIYPPSLPRPALPARDDSLLDVSAVESTIMTPPSSAKSPLRHEDSLPSPVGFGDDRYYSGDQLYSPRTSSSEATLLELRPSRGRADSANSLRRAPAIREHRSRSPLPHVVPEQPNLQRPLRRPPLAITTDLGASYHYPTSATPETPSTPGLPHSDDRKDNSEDSVLAEAPPVVVRPLSLNSSSESPITPFKLPSLEDVFRKDSMMDISAIRARCIRVTGTDHQSHIIDVAALTTAKAISDRIFAKFNIHDRDDQERYGIYSLDAGGELDTEHSLTGEDLVEICHSRNAHLKAHLILMRPDEPWPSSEPPTPTTESPLEGPTEPLASPRTTRRRRGFRQFLSRLNSGDSHDSQPAELPAPVAPVEPPVVEPPQPSSIPMLAPPDQDGYLIGDSDQSDDDMLSAHGVIQNLDHFFGERPPTEVICENLENFFPALDRAESAPPLKMHIKETLARKRVSRAGTVHSSFGRRTSIHPPVGVSETESQLTQEELASIRRTKRSAQTVSRQWHDLVAMMKEDGDTTAEELAEEASGPLEFLSKEKAMLDSDSMHSAEKSSIAPSFDFGRRPMSYLSDHVEVEGTETKEGALPRLARVWTQRPTRPLTNRNSSASLAGHSQTLRVKYDSVRRQSEDRTASGDKEWGPFSRRGRGSRRPSTFSALRNAVASSDLPPFSGALTTGAETDADADEDEPIVVKPSTDQEPPGAGTQLWVPEQQVTIRVSDAEEPSVRSTDPEPSVSGTQLEVPEQEVTIRASDAEVDESRVVEPSAPSTDPEPPAANPQSEFTEPNVPIHVSDVTDTPDEKKPSVQQTHDSAVMLSEAASTHVHDNDAPAENTAAAAAELEDLDGVERTQSIARRAFTIAPDTPREVEWVCGPLIGKGSYGKVYYGVNVKTGEILAVKQVELAAKLPPRRNEDVAGGGKAQPSPQAQVAGKKDVRRRMVDALHREITLLKDLDHENIVRYLGYDTKGKTINVFLEYVSGGSVASSIATMGRFEEPLVRSLTCQILCGLGYLHERSIIHRDIKGGNILLDENGVAKISDFGISKKNEYKFAYRFNSRMSLQGSVHWMAPEVIKGNGYSAKVDIWSLGCLILEMFTGFHPWRQLDELQTMWRLGKENAPPIPDWLSPQAQGFLAKCFAIDPDERPTAAELLTHPFADVDPATFLDFHAYKEAAIEQKRLEEASSDDADYYWDGASTASSWIGGGMSRSSVRRFQSAKRYTVARRRFSQASSAMSFMSHDAPNTELAVTDVEEEDEEEEEEEKEGGVETKQEEGGNPVQVDNVPDAVAPMTEH